MDRGAGRDRLGPAHPQNGSVAKARAMSKLVGGGGGGRHKRCGEQVNPANTEATCGIPPPPNILFSSASDRQRQNNADRRGGSAVAPLGVPSSSSLHVRRGHTGPGGPAGACSFQLGLCKQSLGGRANMKTWATANCHLPHSR